MASPAEGKRKQSEGDDPLDTPVSPPSDGEQSGSQSPIRLEDPPEAGGEREEEQAFLVSLYKFMKERHTPIERVPHLGFKQINLWKIHKAVEKLGAYEMVTGRRLWKNVYDELGGSPGSTSAATCTRRHYERLVLPYVRHLKGEDDKPLPPSKPRKQYKMAKEPRGDDGAPERLKAEEQQRGPVSPEREGRQVMPGKTKMDPMDLARPPSREPAPDRAEQPGPAPGPSLPFAGAGGCPEAYQRLLSSFSCRETHGVMSPLAKKKLLAQASQAEARRGQAERCGHGAGSPAREPRASPAARPPESARSPGGPPESHRHRPGPQEGAQGPGGSLGEQAQAGPHPPAPTFTGCFHAYPTKVLKPISQHPRDFFPHLKDGVLLGCKEERLPIKESALVWGGDVNRPSAFHRGGSRRGSLCPRPKACWVSPMAKVPAESAAPLPAFPGSPGRSKRGREEEGFVPGGKKLQAVPPFLKEADAKECGATAVGPGVALSCWLGPALGPALPEAYRGTMMRCPLNFTGTPDPLKGQATFPFSPLVIPAFPAHFLAAGAPSPVAAGLMHLSPAPFDSALRHRHCPASSAWHVPPATTYAAPHFSFHLNTKL